MCGINEETTQRLLLAEPDLTYKKALEIATNQEPASKNVQTLRGIQGRVGTPISQVPPVEPVHLVKTGKQPQTPPEWKSKDSGGICYRCGRGLLSANLVPCLWQARTYKMHVQVYKDPG